MTNNIVVEWLLFIIELIVEKIYRPVKPASKNLVLSLPAKDHQSQNFPVRPPPYANLISLKFETGFYSLNLYKKNCVHLGK